MIEPRILEVRTKILKKNDELARQMRADFVDAGVLAASAHQQPIFALHAVAHRERVGADHAECHDNRHEHEARH